MTNVSVLAETHPFARALLTEARHRNTKSDRFNQILHALGFVLATHALTDLRDLRTSNVQTPLGAYEGLHTEKAVGLVPVLRAGDSLLPGFRSMLQIPYVWHLGFGRDEETLEPNVYLNKLPHELPHELPHSVRRTFILEVMLATGGSACKAIELAKAAGAKNITFVAVLAAQAGIDRVQREHPDVPIYVIEVDQRLTSGEDGFPRGFIFPGLGDAGDRLYPTE